MTVNIATVKIWYGNSGIPPPDVVVEPEVVGPVAEGVEVDAEVVVPDALAPEARLAISVTFDCGTVMLKGFEVELKVPVQSTNLYPGAGKAVNVTLAPVYIEVEVLPPG